MTSVVDVVCAACGHSQGAHATNAGDGSCWANTSGGATCSCLAYVSAPETSPEPCSCEEAEALKKQIRYLNEVMMTVAAAIDGEANLMGYALPRQVAQIARLRSLGEWLGDAAKGRVGAIEEG